MVLFIAFPWEFSFSCNLRSSFQWNLNTKWVFSVLPPLILLLPSFYSGCISFLLLHWRLNNWLFLVDVLNMSFQCGQLLDIVFRYLVRFQPEQAVSIPGRVLNRFMVIRGILKVTRGTTLPRYRATPRDTQKKDNSTESQQQAGGLEAQMRGNPHSVHVSGASNPMCQVQLSRQKAREEGSIVPGREMIDNQWVPESRFTSHNSEI